MSCVLREGESVGEGGGGDVRPVEAAVVGWLVWVGRVDVEIICKRRHLPGV